MEATEPITKRTKAILEALSRLEAKVDRLQNVTEAVKQVRAEIEKTHTEVHQMRTEEKAAHASWRDIIYRTVTGIAGLINPEKEKRKNENRGNMQTDN